jgi:hypothetical protein
MSREDGVSSRKHPPSPQPLNNCTICNHSAFPVFYRSVKYSARSGDAHL